MAVVRECDDHILGHLEQLFVSPVSSDGHHDVRAGHGVQVKGLVRPDIKRQRVWEGRWWRRVLGR